MTFTCYWKTPDNARHGGEIEARDREEAFALLRTRGIRAIKMEPKGWETGRGYRGVRRRVVVLGVAAAAALGAGVAWWLAWRGERLARYTVITPQGPVTCMVAAPLPRQQIPGDRGRIDTARTAAFSLDAERFLACFAEPGRTVSLKARPTAQEFDAALRVPIRIASTDFTEAVDLKRIVTGMKREMRAYLAGCGTVAGYLAELENRQRLEVSYRESAAKRLSAMMPKEGSAYSYWLKANSQLKSMGIYELPLPEPLRNYQRSIDLDK